MSSFLDTCCKILVPTRGKVISSFCKNEDLDEGIITLEITYSFLKVSSFSSRPLGDLPFKFEQ
jgi:hypothetical protein